MIFWINIFIVVHLIVWHLFLSSYIDMLQHIYYCNWNFSIHYFAMFDRLKWFREIFNRVLKLSVSLYHYSYLDNMKNSLNLKFDNKIKKQQQTEWIFRNKDLLCERDFVLKNLYFMFMIHMIIHEFCYTWE